MVLWEPRSFTCSTKIGWSKCPTEANLQCLQFGRSVETVQAMHRKVYKNIHLCALRCDPSGCKQGVFLILSGTSNKI